MISKALHNLEQRLHSFRKEAAQPVVDASQPEKDWTVLVYAEGRDGLAPSTYRAIQELQKSGSNDKVNLVAQVTSEATWGDRNLPQFGKMPTRTYYLQNQQSTLVREEDKAVPPSPEKLADFIAWGKAHFPARHYLLVIKEHGLGFAAAGNTVPYSARDLDRALTLAEQKSGSGLDVLAMDSCLMDQAEVAYQLRHHAKVMTASPESILAREYPYQTLAESLKRVATLPDANQTPELVGGIVTRLHEKEVPRGIQSALDLGAMDTLSGAMHGLVEQLISAQVPPAALYTQLMRSQSLEPYQTADFAFNYRDLGGFLQGLAEDPALAAPELQKAVAETRAALQKTVLSHAISEKKKEVKNSTGPSAFLPWQHPGQQVADAYGQLDWARDTGWNRLLDYVFTAQPEAAQATVAGTPAPASGGGALARSALHVYKQYMAPYLASACPYEPSCSQYAREAFETHTLPEALELTAMRLIGCSGKGAGGEDPVPPASRDDHGHSHSHHDHRPENLPTIVLTPPARSEKSGLRRWLDGLAVHAANLTGKVLGAAGGVLLGAPIGLVLGTALGWKAGAGTLDAFNERVYQKYGEHKTERLTSLELPVATPGDWIQEKLGRGPLARAVAAPLGALVGALVGTVGGAAGLAGIGAHYTSVLTENVTKDRLGLLPQHYLTQQILTRDYGDSTRSAA